MKPADIRALAEVRAELDRVIRYDDESIVADKWVRQRYDCGCFASLAPARQATVETAWHEAGHAVAALAIGAQFSSASIQHGHGSEGRVHRVTGAGPDSFIIDAAGQIGQRLRDWLPTWQRDGGDARRFRQALRGADEVAAWRRSEAVLTPRRLQIRQVARALLVYPRHLRYDVISALAKAGWPAKAPP
jgi:hypothetical protein